MPHPANFSSRLDATDRRILRALQRNGRLTNAALAEEIGMAPSPCLRRLRALEEDGVIAGYRALIDRRRLGHGVEAYALVKLAQSDPDWRTRLIEQLQAFDEVISCQAMTGECDLLVHIVASDIEAYGEFAMQRLLTLPGVADMRSSFVLATIKPDRGWPI
ncbi:Lrp/AsnC family transcriptional regulator [Bosea sp. (in: a-proteobacteria)]|jgi:Lrp/AsnC family leucine-responsive transcriptional regulator|uniref:Lrp/AsnC family transcriptional regulator n=1 Tax=Bosea sp. (in: a-proteobacteria) TaxID=1871050 RepID=UPI001AC311DD|nr:Lrp/AsnC family transcriptional regulator [Bosea sp. (in: a-proteobacteria)]MBN9436808.1 Lrp/AsnC family transcriptional regulator [Bosea sp. (in: a-proteobacteria)]MBN9469598.1 Lrp/AsnC family transcriptional regulator [Bosea sp. (in: a-proteobacteria)]